MAIVLATLEPPPKRLGVTHWSSRLLAAELGISNVKVADVWREWGLQPWRTQSFRFSTGPQLEAKVRDVIGLYLNPPDKAVVLCVDEKPQTQALERKAPVLPMRPGIPEKRSHDYIRHCACREPCPRHATRRYSLIMPLMRACLRTWYRSRSTGSGSGFSGAAEFRERCGRCWLWWVSY